MGGRSRESRSERQPVLNIDKFQSVRQTDLYSVAASLGLQLDPSDKKQLVGDGHRIAINGEKFNDFETGRGGGGAIDLVMQVKGLDFKEAVDYLGHVDYSQLPTKSESVSSTPSELPKRNTFDDRARDYLVNQRGISSDLVENLISSGRIYEDLSGNVAFTYGDDGVELRGTGKDKFNGFRGSKGTGFVIPADESRAVSNVVIVESSIDALSYKQLHSDSNDVVIALGGNMNKEAVSNAFELAKQYHAPVLSALDNDRAGNQGSDYISSVSDGVQVVRILPHTKDWNDDLRLDNDINAGNLSFNEFKRVSKLLNKRGSSYFSSDAGNIFKHSLSGDGYHVYKVYDFQGKFKTEFQLQDTSKLSDIIQRLDKGEF